MVQEASSPALPTVCRTYKVCGWHWASGLFPNPGCASFGSPFSFDLGSPCAKGEGEERRWSNLDTWIPGNGLVWRCRSLWRSQKMEVLSYDHHTKILSGTFFCSVFLNACPSATHAGCIRRLLSDRWTSWLHHHACQDGVCPHDGFVVCSSIKTLCLAWNSWLAAQCLGVSEDLRQLIGWYQQVAPCKGECCWWHTVGASWTKTGNVIWSAPALRLTSTAVSCMDALEHLMGGGFGEECGHVI